MNKTKIEWCDMTLNPVVGCKGGCPYCYARRLNDRFGFIEEWEDLQFFPERLRKLSVNKPKVIFMNSMSDIDFWPVQWARDVGRIINDHPQHVYLFLTKYHNDLESVKALINELNSTDNVMFGLTITGDNPKSDSIKVRAFNEELPNVYKFISYEPYHGFVGLDTMYYIDRNYHWFIIGAETGSRKRNRLNAREINDVVSFLEITQVFIKDSLKNVVGEGNMRQETPFRNYGDEYL